MTIARIPAKKARIKDLVNGKFFFGSREDMTPSYVITPFAEKIARVNIIGTITGKFVGEEGKYSSITIDDGTGTIRAKSFKGLPFERFNVGDNVRIIGRLKEYNGELYITHEIVENIEDINTELLARAEILSTLLNQKKIVDDIKKMSEQVEYPELLNYAKDVRSIDEETLSVIIESKSKETDYRPIVLEIIKKLDEGKGVGIKRLFEVVDLPANVIEKTLNSLINEGSLYEPQVGFLRAV